MSVSTVRNPVTGRSVTSIIAKPRPSVSGYSKANSWGKWKPKRGKQLTAGQIPDALAAHDRAQEVSDLIRLTLGPWTSEGDLPNWRRVPENQSVSEWRRRVNGNGHAPKPRKQTTKVVAAENPADELAAAVKARAAADARLSSAIVSAREAGVGVSAIASKVGVSRQAIYQRLAS